MISIFCLVLTLYSDCYVGTVCKITSSFVRGTQLTDILYSARMGNTAVAPVSTTLPATCKRAFLNQWRFMILDEQWRLMFMDGASAWWWVLWLAVLCLLMWCFMLLWQYIFWQSFFECSVYVGICYFSDCGSYIKNLFSPHMGMRWRQ